MIEKKRDEDVEKALAAVIADGVREIERKIERLESVKGEAQRDLEETKAKVQALAQLFRDVPELLVRADVIQVGQEPIGCRGANSGHMNRIEMGTEMTIARTVFARDPILSGRYRVIVLFERIGAEE